MKITGLITEYNPFHNGHLLHLEKSKEVTGADYCVAVMSGTFVQRGAPAIYDKYLRTLMALEAGVDLIIELPAAFSTASAREFASYGIALLSNIGADSVCFGSECGRMEPLKEMAALLYKEPEGFGEKIKTHMKSGMTFPQARNSAVTSFFQNEEKDLLTSPNNILAVEYCRAAMELDSHLSLYTIKREGSGYHDNSTEGTLVSASAIRELLADIPSPAAFETMVPLHVEALLRKEMPLFSNDFSSILNYRLWMGIDSDIADMTPELAARIKNSGPAPCSFDDRIKSLKTRQITYTRISRVLLHLLLNIRKNDMDVFKAAGYAPYARILGFKMASSPLLTELKKRTSVPLITKLADAAALIPPAALSMLEQEISAAHLFQTVRAEKGAAFKNEYTQPVVIL